MRLFKLICSFSYFTNKILLYILKTVTILHHRSNRHFLTVYRMVLAFLTSKEVFTRYLEYRFSEG